MQQGRVDRRAVIVLHVMGWFVSAQAAAQSAEPARAALQVRGPAGCVEQPAIVSQVRARSQRIEFVAQAADVPLLAVRAQEKPRGVVAVELTVSWPDKRRSQRALAADGCEEATSAVAFLIALTLDPQAVAGAPANAGEAPSSVSGAPESERARGETARGGRASGGAGATAPTATSAERGAATDPATNAGATAADHAQANAAASSEITRAPSPQAAFAPEPEPAADAAEASAFFAIDELSIGASGAIVSGVAPALMPGVSAQAVLAFHGAGIFAPALQLSAAHAWVNDLSQPGGVADFQRTTVRLDLCPLALRAGFLAARACVSAAAGSLSAQGSETYVPRASSRGWLDLGTSLRGTASIGPVFQVLAGVVLAFPLRRDEFAFRPDVFHRVAALSWEGQLGLGVRFP
jgi:hypothetical protein